MLLKTQNAGQGYGYTKDNQAMYYQGDLTFTPNDIFTIQAGVGKHIIGDGRTSIQTSLWRMARSGARRIRKHQNQELAPIRRLAAGTKRYTGTFSSSTL